MEHENKWMKRRATLDNVQEKVSGAFEYATDQIYDIEGEFNHEWTDCDKIMWQRVFEDLSNTLTGLAVLQMGGESTPPRREGE